MYRLRWVSVDCKLKNIFFEKKRKMLDRTGTHSSKFDSFNGFVCDRARVHLQDKCNTFTPCCHFDRISAVHCSNTHTYMQIESKECSSRLQLNFRIRFVLCQKWKTKQSHNPIETTFPQFFIVSTQQTEWKITV